MIKNCTVLVRRVASFIKMTPTMIRSIQILVDAEREQCVIQ